MPIGYSSPARNFFLLGSSGGDTITNFFRGVDKSADTVFNSFNTSDVQYNGATGSVQEYGISGWKHDSTSAAQAKEHGWIENRTLNLETLATSTIFDATISSTIQSDARVNDILFANGFIYACGFADDADFIAKYDESSGQIISFGSSNLGNNRHFKLAVDANGEIYACGYIETSQNQITVVKYDANLNPVWSKLIDAYGQAALKSIAVAKDGNIVSAGYIGDQAHYDDSNKIKGYVVKVSSFTGEVLWDRTIEDNIGKGEYDFPCNIIVEDVTFNDSGEMFIVGYKSRYSTNFESKDSGFIIKYDDVGNMLWQSTSSYDNVALHSSLHYYRVKTDSDTGQTITLGRLINFDSSPGQNNAAVLLSKYSSSGELLWRREIDSGASNETYDGISLDADSTFYYVAFTDTSESITNSRPDRYVFGKVSTSGNGLGAFQYDDQEGVNLDYVYNGYSDVLGRLSDGSVRNDTSDLVTYPFNANKIVFDDLATHVTNKKAQINTAGNFFKSDFVEIRPTDFQELNLLGDAYSGSGDWLDQSGKGNDAQVSFTTTTTGGGNTSSENYYDGGGLYASTTTYNTYGTVVEDVTTTLPYSNSDWTHYGGKARDLQSGGFKITFSDNSAAQDFFMGCWVKFETYQQSRQMGINLSGNYVYWETLPNGNVAIRHNGGSRADSTGGTGIDDGNWHYISLSRNGNTLAGCVDGTAVITTTNGVSGNSVPSNADFWFFGGNGTSYNIDGKILDPIIAVNFGNAGGTNVPTKPLIDSSFNFNNGGSGTGPFFLSPGWNYASPAISLGGGTTTTTNGPTYTDDGYFEFDGTGDHMVISRNDFTSAGNIDFSIESWFYFDTLPTLSTSKGYIWDQSPGAGGVAFRASTAGDLTTFAYPSGGGGVVLTNSGVTLETGRWYHAVSVFETNKVSLYVDGELSNVTNATIASVAPVGEIDFFIGSAADGGTGSEWMDGRIGEVRIYPRVLTAAQVFQNYNATRYKYDDIAANTSPLTGPGILYDDLIMNFDFGNDYTIERLGTIQG